MLKNNTIAVRCTTPMQYFYDIYLNHVNNKDTRKKNLTTVLVVIVNHYEF